MTAVTERPRAPRCCDEAGCAHDPSAVLTLRAPRPDAVPALAGLAREIAALRARYAAGVAALSGPDAARLHRLLAGAGCVDCGTPTLVGERRCRRCAIADAEAAG